MKRKYINRSKWERIKESKNVIINTYNERFKGYGSAVFIEKVHEKLVCNIDKRKFCLADDGYTWIQRLPINENWAVTTMFDENNNIVQWYFDITKQNSIDDNKQPFYDDLYLDVVVFPSGDIMLFDEDELKAALDSGDITKEDFDLAYSTANKIIDGMAKDVAYLSNMSYSDLEFYKSHLNIRKSINIRPVELNDYVSLSRIRKMDGVMENILATSDEPLDKVKNKILNRTNNDFWFVAEIDHAVVGTAILNRCSNPRKNHVGSLTIMVDKGYQKKGIGMALMKELINLSDNVLKLKRLELFVLADNEIAINLYKKFGFVIEGVQKYSAIKNGEFCDELMMARIN